MIKVAVLDDYQNAFQQIVEVDKHKDKFEFKEVGKETQVLEINKIINLLKK